MGGAVEGRRSISRKRTKLTRIIAPMGGIARGAGSDPKEAAISSKMYRPAHNPLDSSGHGRLSDTARPALQGDEMPAHRRIRPQGVKLRSVVEKPLQLLKLVSEVRILVDLALDLADRVQNRRVVAATEPPPNLRQ
jgi:hypothetical protein